MKKQEQSFLINSGCKASEIIASDPQMIRLIETLGIPMGFGDMTVGQLCSKDGMPVELFTALANMVAHPGYRPDPDDLNENDLSFILKYLEATHRNYMNISLPNLHANVHKIAALCNDETKMMVNQFFDDYDAEMKRHIESEESEEFAYIRGLLSGIAPDDRTVDSFLEQHDDVEVKLDDFKNIIVKYVPQECNIPERYLAVIQMLHIADELSFHTRIEEQLLFPLAIKLEKRLRG